MKKCMLIATAMMAGIAVLGGGDGGTISLSRTTIGILDLEHYGPTGDAKLTVSAFHNKGWRIGAVKPLSCGIIIKNQEKAPGRKTFNTTVTFTEPSMKDKDKIIRAFFYKGTGASEEEDFKDIAATVIQIILKPEYPEIFQEQGRASVELVAITKPDNRKVEWRTFELPKYMELLPSGKKAKLRIKSDQGFLNIAEGEQEVTAHDTELEVAFDLVNVRRVLCAREGKYTPIHKRITTGNITGIDKIDSKGISANMGIQYKASSWDRLKAITENHISFESSGFAAAAIGDDGGGLRPTGMNTAKSLAYSSLDGKEKLIAAAAVGYTKIEPGNVKVSFQDLSITVTPAITTRIWTEQSNSLSDIKTKSVKETRAVGNFMIPYDATCVAHIHAINMNGWKALGLATVSVKFNHHHHHFTPTY